jgi:hypothetical protein
VKYDHLAKAKEYLVVAESKDAKREAFKLAAGEIRTHRAETGATYTAIAEALGRESNWVRTLVKWHEDGCKANTPWAIPSENDRVRFAHAKRAMRDQPVEAIKEMLDDLPDDVVTKIAEATEGTRITRRLYADRPKPTVKEANRKVKAADSQRMKDNPWEASARLGSTIGSARAAIRAVVHQYQEFVALVEDDEFLTDGRERLVGLRADIDLALGALLEGSIEEAFSELLDKEAK